jgi:hypothetical protein
MIIFVNVVCYVIFFGVVAVYVVVDVHVLAVADF